ncbi:MAG: hypothetical protein ACYTFG_09180 [Planctomycetota bacterium]|jgi:hypothetical protein
MSPRKQDESEPEPIDPKAASRAITRHIQRKRATEKQTRNSTPGDETKEKVVQAPPALPEEDEDFIKAVPIQNRDLVLLMEHSPDSRMGDWIFIQTGEEPERALKISMAEMEFLLLKRSLLD